MSRTAITQKQNAITLPGNVSRVGWQIPEGLTLEEWKAAGDALKLAQGSVLWWIGDWLNFGERKYGEKYSEALDATEYEYQTLANAKLVAASFQFSRRRENLSWSHHADVASLPPFRADELLERAENEKLSSKAFRRIVRQPPASIPKAVTGKYSLILADPPWLYDFSPTSSREIENHYGTLDVDKICEIGAGMPFADDAALFLWATAPKLREALQVMEAWGFRYVTHAVWDKQIPGMGYWFRGQHEPLLVGVKGKFPPPPESLRGPSVISERREGHSEKPLAVFDYLNAAYPTLDAHSKLEMFAREPREGWTPWGNDPQAQHAA